MKPGVRGLWLEVGLRLLTELWCVYTCMWEGVRVGLCVCTCDPCTDMLHREEAWPGLKDDRPGRQQGALRGGMGDVPQVLAPMRAVNP